MCAILSAKYGSVKDAYLCGRFNLNKGPVKKEKILGLGVNLSGRINHYTGYSYSFFNFNEEPLTKSLEKELNIKTFLENDSRAMAYGEFNAGLVKDEKMYCF